MGAAFLRDIHRFWFGELTSPADFHAETVERWFRRSDATDAEIRERFGGLLPDAAKRDWDLGRLAPEEGVALVILFDQFPRNLFRRSDEAFAHDPKARDLARRLIARGADRHAFVERVALALPFEHSEEPADQDCSVFLLAGLAVNGPDGLRDFLRSQLDYATRHRDVIRTFGRFPHRNALLSRNSTAEEIAFLKRGRGF